MIQLFSSRLWHAPMLTNKVIDAFGMHINLCGKKGLKGNEENTLIYIL